MSLRRVKKKMISYTERNHICQKIHFLEFLISLDSSGVVSNFCCKLATFDTFGLAAELRILF